MGKYSLKIRLSDGAELDFNTSNRAIVQTQLDEYFNIIIYGSNTVGPTAARPAEVEQEAAAKTDSPSPEATVVNTPKAPVGDFSEKEWETQQEAVAQRYIEKLPDAPLHKLKPKTDESAVCFNSDCSTDVLSKDIADKSKDLFGAFIITANFIKNNLDMQNFSIKFLNSKLYEASGKLIDHDIISEGLDKGYINISEDSEGPLKYSLSAKGEEYYSRL